MPAVSTDLPQASDSFFVFDIVFSATRPQFIRKRYNGIASVMGVRNNLHCEMFCLT